MADKLTPQQEMAVTSRGGKLLDDMLELIDLDRHKNVYIANIVNCRFRQDQGAG